MYGLTNLTGFGAGRRLQFTWTWNPSDKATNVTLSNGNRDMTGIGSGGGNQSVRGTIGISSSGKKYFEVDILGTPNASTDFFGFADNAAALIDGTKTMNQIADGGCVGVGTSGSYYAGSDLSVGAGTLTVTAGDILAIAIDVAAGNAWLAQNNSWVGSGDPAAGTNPKWSGIDSGTYYPAATASGNTTEVRLRVRATPFYAPPTGFTCL